MLIPIMPRIVIRGVRKNIEFYSKEIRKIKKAIKGN